MKLKLFVFGFSIIGLMSCKQKIDLPSFNSEIWKSDANACREERNSMGIILLNNKEELKKYKEDDLIDLLGKPDRTHPSGRGKSHQIWFIEKGDQCIKPNNPSKSARLIIEFDFLGNVQIIRKSYMD